MPRRDPPQRPATLPLVELFSEHRQSLAAAVRSVLGWRTDVAEVLQEAFLKAWRSRTSGTPLRDPVAWMHVLTLNLAKDLRRRQRRQNIRGLEEETMEQCAKEPPPPTTLERDEAVNAARGAIERLQDPEKEIFLLRVSAGLSYEAAAKALGIPVGTAKTRMRAALGRLRQDLAPFAPDAWAPAGLELGPRRRRTS